jgi:hypothetical protein
VESRAGLQGGNDVEESVRNFALLMLAGCARTPKNVVDDVGKAIGAGNLKSIQYSGSGYIYAIGQELSTQRSVFQIQPEKLHPRGGLRQGRSARRGRPTQFENPPRGGGVQPVIGEGAPWPS